MKSKNYNFESNQNMNTESDGLSVRSIVKFVLGGIVALTLTVVGFWLIGSNNDQSWQILQYVNGDVRVVDSSGYYNTWLGRVTTYPRNFQVEYDKDDSFAVTFNDASTAKMTAMVRISAPTTVEQKREFHRQFGGNMENVEAAVWAHLSNAIKASGPIMSSSEHQSARQSEFNQLVYEQLNHGLYETRKVMRTLHDQFDDKGKPITVWATEVVTDDKGNPRIANVSPLAKLGLTVTQFSITHTEYDKMTQDQFAAKKQAFLAAENSKAQREKEVQERLMVEEKGRREKAEAEAKALKQKAEEVINAQREKEVAELNAMREKAVAETNAARELAVAQLVKEQAQVKANQEKIVAETAAQRELEVARLNKLAAEENAAKQIALAKAQEESLKIAGAISEKDRVLAEIEREKAIGVARELSKIAVPTTVINSGGNGTSGSNTAMENLISLTLMEKLNSLPTNKK